MQAQPTPTADVSAILPTLLAMPPADKLRVIEALANDLGRRDLIEFDPNVTHEFWSPYDCDEAAATLMKVLDEHRQTGIAP